MRQYLETKDLSLSLVFEMLDSDSNKMIDFTEFKKNLGIIGVDLTDYEARILFDSIDKDRSGSIIYREFATEFVEINSAYKIKKLGQIIRDSG